MQIHAMRHVQSDFGTSLLALLTCGSQVRVELAEPGVIHFCLWMQNQLNDVGAQKKRRGVAS